MERDEDLQIEPPSPCLNNLNSALHQLGMLAASTNSRRQYLKEISRRQLNNLHINTRYVSNVSIGFRVRPITPHARFKPYTIERQRTRSENNENDKELVETVVSAMVLPPSDDLAQLKRAKSLESIIAESNSSVNLDNIKFSNSPEMEVVSNSIQNLKVVE